MQIRCPEARIFGTSMIEDYRLLFKGSQSGCYLTIEPQKGSHVPVAVWLVTDADEAALDRYEGFPAFYYKKEMTLPIQTIKSDKIQNRKVFVYIMHEERSLGLPKNTYFETCLQGYRSFGFSEDFLKQAYIDSKQGGINYKNSK